MLTQHSSESQNIRLLLLNDHNNVESGATVFSDEGYRVRCEASHSYSSDILKSYRPDIVLVDLERPSVQSVSICQDIRRDFDGPILVLSAQTDSVVQVLGLEMGADDFLFKPQPSSLLLAKLRVFIRRIVDNKRSQQKFVQLGDLTIDAERREVNSSGEIVSLTSREFDLLWCLAENVRSTISREKIHQRLYNSEYNGYDRSIDIYISRIRQKIGDNPVNPRYLKTVRGSGYLLVEDKA